jgi:anti-sigma regulatory factor (Ser/Thr protein kinase)
MARAFRITRAAYSQSLDDFRAFIRERCANLAGMDADILYDLQLAVDEACTNIITHGYADMDPGSIILDLEIEPGKITLALTDFGHSFEPDNAPVPDIEAALAEHDTGGFGIFFIRQSVDRLEYRVTEDGNTMTLTKYLGAPAGGNT